MVYGKPNAYTLNASRLKSFSPGMMVANAMDQDDNVEHLFSWLQTPELRYREFAGAREITDAVVTFGRPGRIQRRLSPPERPPRETPSSTRNTRQDQFPDQVRYPRSR